MSAAKSFPDLERVVQSAVGRTGLMLFAEFELGAVLRRETGLETPKIVRFLVGNPLIMKEMSSTFPMLALTHRSQSLSMKTKWRVACFLTATRTLLPSPEILIQKLQPCYANAQAEMGQKCSTRLSLRRVDKMAVMTARHHQRYLGVWRRTHLCRACVR